MPASRRNMEETWRFFEAQGVPLPRDAQGHPLPPQEIPSIDDEDPFPYSFFRSVEADLDLSNLTFPRMFFCRSTLERFNFHNADLSESYMCWNDFIDCDFSGADLHGANMRASVYRRCRFTGACLANADLRGSSFEKCDFTDARMEGAKLTRMQRFWLALSPAQKSVVECSWRLPPPPPGG